MDFDILERREGYWFGRATVTSLLRNGSDPTASAKNRGLMDYRLSHEYSAFYGMRRSEAQVLNSYPAGLELADSLAAEMPKVAMKGIKARKHWSEDGDDFSRERFEAGHEACWLGTRRERGIKKPIIRITVAIGATACVDADDLAWSGAAAFAIIDAAESAGYQIELDAYSYAADVFPRSHATPDMLIEVPLKAAGEPLDRETVAMALTCPAFFRWHVMNARMAVESACGRGMGSTRPTPDRYIGDLHLPHAYGRHSAEAAVREAIAKIEAGRFDNAAVAC